MGIVLIESQVAAHAVPCKLYPMELCWLIMFVSFSKLDAVNFWRRKTASLLLTDMQPCSRRYKLVKPAEQYNSLHKQLQRLLDLCSSAVKLLKHNSSLTPLAAAKAALAEEESNSSAEEQWPGQVAFVEAQLSAWMEVSPHPHA